MHRVQKDAIKAVVTGGLLFKKNNKKEQTNLANSCTLVKLKVRINTLQATLKPLTSVSPAVFQGV